MKPRRVAVSALVLAAVALGACGRNEPTAPGAYAITGHVVLIGYLVNQAGVFIGNRLVGDADGVAVELLYGTQVVARTATVDGVYRFSGIGPGGYVARASVIGDIADRTLPLTVTTGDVRAGDTLKLISRGDLLPIPNPVSPTGTTVYFALPDTQEVEVRILDLAGRTERILLDAVRLLGINQARWDGLGPDSTELTGAQYWVTLVTPGSIRAHLLFK